MVARLVRDQEVAGSTPAFPTSYQKNIDGGCGEVANTSGCEPDIREFDPPQPPQVKKVDILRHSAVCFFFS